jgi:sporulation protein YlmC with PRC-barrel domain
MPPTPNLIRLNCSRADVDRMEPFITTRYIPSTEAQIPTAEFTSGLAPLLYPAVLPATEKPMPVSEEHLPAGEKEIYRGMAVEATDGKIGQVDELMVEPESWQITQVVLRRGHLWGKKEITLPLSDVDSVRGDTVFLKIDKATVKSRPSIPVKRFFD